MTQIIGYLLFIAAGAFLVQQAFKIWKKARPQSSSVDVLSPMEDQLPGIKAEHFVVFLGDDKNYGVVQNLDLIELEQKTKGGPWVPKGGKSRLIELEDMIIAYVPSKDGGRSTVLKLQLREASGLRNFFKGTEDNPGPAKQFARKGQAEPIEFKLPDDVKTTWKMLDIGAFQTERVSGKNTESFYDGDLFMFVTAREKDGERWLLFLDARSEAGFETEGRGGLYVGTELNPNAEIKDIF